MGPAKWPISGLFSAEYPMISVDLRVPAPPHVRATAGPRRATPPPQGIHATTPLALVGAGPGGASRAFCDGVEPKLAPHARLHDPEDLACVHREVLHDVVDRAHPRHIDALNRDARFERGVVA